MVRYLLAFLVDELTASKLRKEKILNNFIGFTMVYESSIILRYVRSFERLIECFESFVILRRDATQRCIPLQRDSYLLPFTYALHNFVPTYFPYVWKRLNTIIRHWFLKIFFFICKLFIMTKGASCRNIMNITNARLIC